MDSPHRLHPVDTSPTESSSVPAAEDSNKACGSCLEPLSQIEKPHPVHPDHGLDYITLTLPWKCDACKRDSANIQEIQCYRCEQCEFYVCKSCLAGVNSQVHHNHPLYRTDVRSIYSEFNGSWKCDICRGNNGPGHFFPAHCSSCKFDLCDNCMKPYRSTHHVPGHVLHRADSNATYPQHNGNWFCDRCRQRYNSKHAPYHCSQCEYDLCESCMKGAGEESNAVTSETRSPCHTKMSEKRKPLAAPSDEVNRQTGRSGPPDKNVLCPYCLKRPKNAQIVHSDGLTGHLCCCVQCAEDYRAKHAGCPVCKAPIKRIIKVFNS